MQLSNRETFEMAFSLLFLRSTSKVKILDYGICIFKLPVVYIHLILFLWEIEIFQGYSARGGKDNNLVFAQTSINGISIQKHYSRMGTDIEVLSPLLY